jgi:F-type H+-transporting ATPase subunit epsilon
MADGSAHTFDLALVTPEGPAFEGEAEMVVVPGDAGEIGVLARHAPLVALLRAGETRVKSGGQWQSFATGPGYFKVQKDRAIALVDDAVKADQIDRGGAERQLDEAKAELERVEQGESSADRWMLEQRIIHYETQIEVASGSADIRTVRAKLGAGEHHA